MGGKRAVERISESGIVDYQTIKEAALSVSGHASDIGKAIKRSKVYKGFLWRYKEYIIDGENWRRHPTLDLDCSNLGRVRNSITLRVLTSFRISAGKDRHQSYLLTRCGSRNYKVHRLVAETFLLNPEHKPTVDHLYSDPTNNNVTNLRYATYKEQWETRRENLPISPILDQ
jgi:hypothetical protein